MDTLKTIYNMKNSILNHLGKFDEEDREFRILDSKLHALSQRRKSNIETSFPTLSPQFEARLSSRLKEIKPESKSSITYLYEFANQKMIQYPLSLGLAAVFLFVVLSPKTETPVVPETSKVVVENSEFLNVPSSVNVSQTKAFSDFKESVQKNPSHKEALKNLEFYFQSSGKEVEASNIHSLLEKL
jgi:hypothetical protein